MRKTILPQELIEDYKSNARITDLCRKYELTYRAVKSQLIKMGLSGQPIRGGYREGCGRKKKETGGELHKIRAKNQEMKFTQQPEGVKANPRSNLCRKYNNDYYMGGF